MDVAYTKSAALGSFCAVRRQYEAMVEHLESRAALGMTHDQLEAYVVREGRELERRMLQAHLDLRAAAEVPVRVVDAAGTERRDRRRGERALMSLVGEVGVTRLLYQAVGEDRLAPQDGMLNLPEESFSLGVRRRVAEEVASGSFDHAVERVVTTTGARIAKRQVEELAQRAASDFDAFYAQHEEDPVAEVGALLVLSFDGAGIVMRAGDLREATRRAAQQQANDVRWPPKRLGRGQKRNRKRMAEVAAVYGLPPHVRRPKDIVRELRPVHDTSPSTPRPRPVNKRVWASVEKDAAVVIDAAFEEALRRDPHHQRRWVVLVDGAETQLELVHAAARRAQADITVIVDLIHVLEYLWKAAYCFHANGSAQAEGWVTERLVLLLEGTDPSQVAAGMRRSATLRGLARRDAVDAAADYLCKYRNHIRYGEAIAYGLPIATGVIEGACRYLVRDRMDKTGARWSVAGAESVLRLRALRTNGDFDAYWQYHLAAEFERNHASRYNGSHVPNPLPRRGHLRRVK